MDVRHSYTWSLRKSGEDYDMAALYGSNHSYFTLEFHHGGEFSEFPYTIYHNGIVNFIDMVDSRCFSLSIIDNMLEELGYETEDVKRRHYKIPGEELDFGLRPLTNETDVNMLTKYVEKHKVIEVYVEHVRDGDNNKNFDFIVDKDTLVEDVNVDIAEFRDVVDCEGEDLIIDEELVDHELDLDDFDSPTDSNSEPLLEAALSSIRKKKKKTEVSQRMTKTDFVWDYCEELIRSNSGTTVKIDVEKECSSTSQTRQFRRIYICLGGLKVGFQKCGRELLGLDGCFIKGPYPGQILTAVGVDANNGIYHVAYSIVESESASSSTWFLECLRDDLDLSPNSNFTFISDRQKGIIPAITKVFPSAKYRYCLRHIHENMKQKWSGQVYKDLIWKCASATTIQGFDRVMNEVLKQNKTAHEWLKTIPPRHWSRAHFSCKAKCDVLLNNLCEVFNRQLVGGRDKPIITCLEFIKEYLMKRIIVVQKIIAKCSGPLTPAITKIFEQIKTDATHYTVIWNGMPKYQVSGSEHDQCVVLMDQRSCSCRKWELTGIPCKHAVACIWNMAMNGIGDGIPEK